MALPQAIERQAAEAEEMQKAVYEGQASPTEVEQPAPVEAPPAELAPPANVVELPQPTAPAKPVEGEDPNYWKKRFETVQGKLDAEMPRLFQQLREQGETIKQLSVQLAEAKKPPAEPAPATESLVTQKDIDEYGEELIDAMRRTAREEARKAFAAEHAALEQRFGAVETRVGQVGQEIERSSIKGFWSDVIALVPDWPQIDQNPAWIAWLDTAPEFSVASYRELAAQAIDKGDSQKIVKLVKIWQKETGQEPPPAPPAAATPARPQSELERQVAPSTVRGAAAPAAQKMYTRAEYEALYDVRNVQRFGEKKAAEMIAEADLAVAENRVRWV